MPNPIIQRELFGMLRTRRALAVQVLLAVALAGLVLLYWPTDARVELSFRQSRQVLRVFGYGALVGIMVLVAVFPATTVVREKQQGTLALLLNSPMGPGSILFGKLVAAMGFAAILLVLSLPAAAAVYAMGGVSLTQLGQVYLVLSLLALQNASLALLISSYAGNSDSALRLTFGVILAIAVLPLVLIQFISPEAQLPLAPGAFIDHLGTLPQVARDDTYEMIPPAIGIPAYTVILTVGAVLVYVTRFMSPIAAMMQVLGHGDFMSQGLLTDGNDLPRYAVFALFGTLVCLGLTYKRFRGRMLDRPRAAGKITQDQGGKTRVLRALMFLYFFDPQSRSGLIQPFINPVMVKEFRCRVFGRGHWMMRLIGVVLITSLGLMLAATRATVHWGVGTLGAIMVVLQMGIVMLVTPALASGLVSSERESGGWDLLRMTPLSAFSILFGKFLSVIWMLVLLLAATLPGYVIIIKISSGEAYRVQNVLISLGLTFAFVLFASAAISSLFKRTAAATATAYTFVIGLVAGTMLFWLGRDAPFSAQTVETALMFNPLAAALSLIDAPGFGEYQLVPGNWYVMGGGAVLSLAVLAVQTWRLTRPS